MTENATALIAGPDRLVRILEMAERRKPAPTVQFGQVAQHRPPCRFGRLLDFAPQGVAQCATIGRGGIRDRHARTKDEKHEQSAGPSVTEDMPLARTGSMAGEPGCEIHVEI